MNHTLSNLVKVYATGDHSAVRACLQGMSQDTLIAVTTDLLTTYFNDTNSSTLREWVTATICGYTHESRKMGYNGYRHDGISSKIQHCEVKPRNCVTSPGKARPVLNGIGVFNGYTHKRFHKDRKENPMLLLSGFVDGRLIYILEVPFNSPGIVKSLGEKVRHFLPDGDVTSRYIIGGAMITFNDYKDSPDLRIPYVVSLEKLEELCEARPRRITQKILDFLLSRAYPGQSRLFTGGRRRKTG